MTLKTHKLNVTTFTMFTFTMFAALALLLSDRGEVCAEEVTHSFLACGSKTYIVDGQGNISWKYPHSTRDGYILPDGNAVLTLTKSKQHKGGAVVIVTPEGKETLVWEGTQDEVNSTHPTEAGTYVITEAGPKPRLLELDRKGKIQIQFPLNCQRANAHMQTRMARKLSDGSYMAPHLLDFAVFHYSSTGEVLGKLDTTVPGDTQHNIHSWPFTAIRHSEGHTLVCCTHGNRVIDFDAEGNIAWQLTNEDLPGPWLQDPCGGQVLPNGNIVITSYAAGAKDPNAPKLIEVNREKEVVWTYSNSDRTGIHHFQILDTNGKKIAGSPLK